MKRIDLVLPDKVHSKKVMEYRKDFLDREESLDGTSGLKKFEDYEDWLGQVISNLSEETVGPGLVPSATYLAISKTSGRLVGMVDIRYYLNEGLLQHGGNIGYSVRMDERRKGYAKEILGLALEKCRALNMDRVLLTCDKNNIASSKTILGNGGVLENSIKVNGGIIERYWIDI